MGDDNRWRDEHTGDWGDRFRRGPDRGDDRRYGADDFEQGSGEVRYGDRFAYPPSRAPRPYRDDRPRGWDRAAEQGYGPRRARSSDGRPDFSGWDAPFGGRPVSAGEDRDGWDRLREEGRSFLDRTRDELSALFGARRDEERRADQSRGGYRGHGPRGYRRSDERIHEDINDRLTEDPWLDASDIEVQVAAGEVTLNGTVKARADKRRAEDIAEHVSGVDHVQNNLRAVPDDPRPKDTVVLPMV